MVDAPDKYRWSSYRSKVRLGTIDWLDLDPFYLGLGDSDGVRAAKYREWVEDCIPEGEWEFIRTAVQRGQLTGSERFVDAVAEKMGKWVELRAQGRPKGARK